MLTIRPCQPAEVPAAGALYRQVVAYLQAHINYPKWDESYPSEESARAATAARSQFLAWEDTTPVGAFVLNDDPQGAYEKGAWGCEVTRGEYLIFHALAVAPAWQGRGVGLAMVRYGIALARERGYRAIRLDVVPGNTPAARLYESAGFQYRGTVDLERGIERIPRFDLYELDLGSQR